MEIKHHSDGQKGAFFFEENGKRLAEMTYEQSGPSRITIDHTEVSVVLKGKGVGRQLVRAGVEYARENQLKIFPLCPFAKAEFEKTPEYADVLAG
jgi:uncharacterized protein